MALVRQIDAVSAEIAALDTLLCKEIDNRYEIRNPDLRD
jgi:hypothetical protein